MSAGSASAAASTDAIAITTNGVERVGSKLLFENDRVRVWELRLAPGQTEALHEHKHDYVMIQIDGDRVAGEFEPDSGGPWGGETHVEGDVANGLVIFADVRPKDRLAPFARLTVFARRVCASGTSASVVSGAILVIASVHHERLLVDGNAARRYERWRAKARRAERARANMSATV